MAPKIAMLKDERCTPGYVSLVKPPTGGTAPDNEHMANCVAMLTDAQRKNMDVWFGVSEGLTQLISDVQTQHYVTPSTSTPTP